MTLTSTCGYDVMTEPARSASDRPLLCTYAPRRMPGQQAVTGRGQVPVDDVPTLLAADRVVTGVERLEHGAITDGRGDDVDARRLHRLVEAEVAHHGDDHRVAW